MKIDNRISAAVIIATLVVVGYIFYHEAHPIDESALESQKNTAFNLEKVGQGESLKDLVAKPGGIYMENAPENQLSEQAKQLVGRYLVRLSCEDPIAKCTNGSADYIVTLLDTGHVRRTIVYLGSVSPIDERQYRKDFWSYDEEHKEVIIHLVEGVNFYFNVNAAHNLVVNVEKTATASKANQEFFSQNALPLHAYELKRDNKK